MLPMTLSTHLHWLISLIAKFVNKVPSRVKQAYAKVGQMVEERRQRAEDCKANKEEWEDKPVRKYLDIVSD